MKINIVTEHKPGWILRKMSENWQKYLPGATITEMVPCQKSDINFYVNWDIFESKTNIDVGWFTHREFDIESSRRFDLKAKKIDFCVCPSKKTYDLLPKNKSFIVKHGISDFFNKIKNKIVFGIVGREYSSGRKRMEMVYELEKIPNTKFLVTNGNYSDEMMPNFYKQIDYLLILSNNEGGPVPILEALSMGKPIIAPDVGWCWEYPVIRYDNDETLKNIISGLISCLDNNHLWKKSSEDLYKIFESLFYGKKIKLTKDDFKLKMIDTFFKTQSRIEIFDSPLYNELVYINNRISDWKNKAIKESFMNYEESKYDLSLKIVNNVLKMDPTSIEGNYLKSLCLVAKDQFDEAEILLSKILKIDPKNIASILQKGIIKLNKKNYNEAIKLFDLAINIDPASIDSYLLKSEVYLSDGNIDQSINSMIETRNIFPNNLINLERMCQVYFQINNLEDAKEIAENIIRLDKKNLIATKLLSKLKL